MTTYRRKKDRDTWHWCRNCSNWPTSDYEEVSLPDGERPSSGELDNECRAKGKVGDCSTKKKPYHAPKIKTEKVFESNALACGKTNPQMAGCLGYLKIS